MLAGETVCCVVSSRVTDLRACISHPLAFTNASPSGMRSRRVCPTMVTVNMVSHLLPMWCDERGHESGLSYTRLTLVE
jgi:uncharacterized membrane protein